MSIRRTVPLLPALAAVLLSLSLIAACSSGDSGGGGAGGDGQGAAAASDSSGEAGTGAATSAEGVYKLTQTFETSTIEITSDVFSRIRRLKIDYTCPKQRNLNQKGEWEVGLDKSPPMMFSGVPEGAVSLALIMDDPDVIEPEAEIFEAKIHWVLWNLPPDTTELPVHLATTTELATLGPNVRQGTNDYGVIGYTGPCPTLSTLSIAQSGGTYDPMSHIYTGIPVLPHGYVIKVYALSKELDLPAGATKYDLLKAMDGSIIAGGEAVAEYRPKALLK
jgi:Raf kinase inhibitor-like YbhB/YbcL family protein